MRCYRDREAVTNRSERYIVLDEGGSVYVRLECNIMRLSPRDRRLIFAVADALAAHQYPVITLTDPREAVSA